MHGCHCGQSKHQVLSIRAPYFRAPHQNPIFRLCSCPPLPEHLAVSFYPALQAGGNRPVLCLAVSDMTPEMEMKPWIFIRRGRCPRRPGPGEEAGRGGSASQGEAQANGGGARRRSSVIPPYMYARTYTLLRRGAPYPTAPLYPST